jgi:hypothetical protein
LTYCSPSKRSTRRKPSLARNGDEVRIAMIAEEKCGFRAENAATAARFPNNPQRCGDPHNQQANRLIRILANI